MGVSWDGIILIWDEISIFSLFWQKLRCGLGFARFHSPEIFCQIWMIVVFKRDFAGRQKNVGSVVLFTHLNSPLCNALMACNT